MKIEVVKDPVFKTGCNFCNNNISVSTPVFQFIRDSNNSFRARICDNCLSELIDFRQKHLEKIF